MAMHFYGSPRLTNDVIFLLRKNGYVRRDIIRQNIIKTKSEDVWYAMLPNWQRLFDIADSKIAERDKYYRDPMRQGRDMENGENAPDFMLKDGEGKDWKLSEQKGKTVVMLFYPADNSPVCTKQLCSVRDHWSEYKATGAEVVGISTDTAQSHKVFAEKNELPLTLLADNQGEVTSKYNVKSWLPNRSARAVVVVNKAGKIAYHKVQALSLFAPSDADVIAAIRAAQTGESGV